VFESFKVREWEVGKLVVYIVTRIIRRVLDWMIGFNATLDAVLGITGNTALLRLHTLQFMH
jgi:hypothetical protein